MRKLSRLETIIEINPIEGADLIEVATVQGWQVVVKKNEFKVGDHAAYFEIDSWIPEVLAPFLTKKATAGVYKGVAGNRLRTVKLKGQISQGLLLSLDTLKKQGYNLDNIQLGEDISELLNVKLYEPPVKPQLDGTVKGNFPSFITKTDEERVQNIKYEDYLDKRFYITEKLEGSSMTVYYKDGELGVCSRNLDLKETDSNTFWQVANKYELRDKLCTQGVNIAIQGELIGPGIQGNIYKLDSLQFRPFSVFNIDSFKKESLFVIQFWCNLLGLEMVPLLERDVTLPTDRKELIKLADGVSQLNNKVKREGLVFRDFDNTTSFKVISNQYLLKAN